MFAGIRNAHRCQLGLLFGLVVACGNSRDDRKITFTLTEGNEVYSVGCNLECTSCTLTPINGGKSTTITEPGHPVLDDCIERRARQGSGGTGGMVGSGGRPGGGSCDDDPSMNFVVFSAAGGSDNRYGFDSWRTMQCASGTAPLFVGQNTSYISLATLSDTKFNIQLSTGSAFSDYEARFSSNDAALTFNGWLTQTLHEGDNELTLSSSALNGTAEIEVWGINGADSACLAGPRGASCPSADDRLTAVVYDPLKLSTPHRVYFLGNPAFQPTAEEWRAGFNQMLKQGVADLEPGSVVTSHITDDAWDVNGNGKVDFLWSVGIEDGLSFGDSTVVPDFFGLVNWAGEETGCQKDVNSATFVIDGDMRANWVLTESYYKNSTQTNDTLRLAGLGKFQAYTIQEGGLYRIARYKDPDQDQDGHHEAIQVMRVVVDDAPRVGDGYIIFDRLAGGGPLTKDYNVNDGIVVYGDVPELLGLTPPVVGTGNPASCTFLTQGARYETAVHEFLHQGISGFFRHVSSGDEFHEVSPYTTNLMFYGIIPGAPPATELRYRPLLVRQHEEVDASGSYSQWAQFHVLQLGTRAGRQAGRLLP